MPSRAPEFASDLDLVVTDPSARDSVVTKWNAILYDKLTKDAAEMALRVAAQVVSNKSKMDTLTETINRTISQKTGDDFGSELLELVASNSDLSNKALNKQASVDASTTQRLQDATKAYEDSRAQLDKAYALFKNAAMMQEEREFAAEVAYLKGLFPRARAA
jgi:hypothetical protein